MTETKTLDEMIKLLRSGRALYMFERGMIADEIERLRSLLANSEMTVAELAHRAPQ